LSQKPNYFVQMKIYKFAAEGILLMSLKDVVSIIGTFVGIAVPMGSTLIYILT